MKDFDPRQTSCGCCRRDFLGAAGVAAGAATLRFASLVAADQTTGAAAVQAEPATVRVAFLYPPSATLRVPGGWWSWPGNDFDAEARHQRYAKRLKEIEQKLAMRILLEKTPLVSEGDVTNFISQVKQAKPDGLLLIPLYNGAFGHVNRILDEVAAKPAGEGEAGQSGIPSVVFSTLASITDRSRDTNGPVCTSSRRWTIWKPSSTACG